MNVRVPHFVSQMPLFDYARRCHTEMTRDQGNSLVSCCCSLGLPGSLEQDIFIAVLALHQQGVTIFAVVDIARILGLNSSNMSRKITKGLFRLANSQYAMKGGIRANEEYNFRLLELQSFGQGKARKFSVRLWDKVTESIATPGKYQVVDIAQYLACRSGLPRRAYLLLEKNRRLLGSACSISLDYLCRWMPVEAKKVSDRIRTVRKTLEDLVAAKFLTSVSVSANDCCLIFAEEPVYQKPTQQVKKEPAVALHAPASPSPNTKAVVSSRADIQKAITEKPLFNAEIRPGDLTNASSTTLLNETKSLITSTPIAIEITNAPLPNTPVEPQPKTFDIAEAVIVSKADKLTYAEKIALLQTDLPKMGWDEITNWMTENYPSIRLTDSSPILRHHNGDKDKIVRYFPHLLLICEKKHANGNPAGPGLITNLLKSLEPYQPSEAEIDIALGKRQEKLNKASLELRRKVREERERLEREAEEAATKEKQRQEACLFQAWQQRKGNLDGMAIFEKAQSEALQHDIIKNTRCLLENTTDLKQLRKIKEQQQTLLQAQIRFNATNEIARQLGMPQVYFSREAGQEVYQWLREEFNQQKKEVCTQPFHECQNFASNSGIQFRWE